MKKYFVYLGKFDRKTDEVRSDELLGEFNSYEEALAFYNSIDLEHETSLLCDADRKTFYFEKSLGFDLLDDEGDCCNEYEILEAENYK